MILHCWKKMILEELNKAMVAWHIAIDNFLNIGLPLFVFGSPKKDHFGGGRNLHMYDDMNVTATGNSR